MTAPEPNTSRVPRSEPQNAPPLRYVRAPRPLHFPESAEVPEHKLHQRVRTALFQLLELYFAEHAWLGSDQFVYYDAADPGACLAPDAFVRLGGPDELFGSWKVWERGAPELAVEVVSDSDRGERAWSEKLVRYAHLGVDELVRFDPDARSLAVWDRVEGDLVERVIDAGAGEGTFCRTLGLWWVITEDGPWLRLGRDAEGRDLLLTESELKARAQKAAEEREREAQHRESEARSEAQAARARVEELERALRQRG